MAINLTLPIYPRGRSFEDKASLQLPDRRYLISFFGEVPHLLISRGGGEGSRTPVLEPHQTSVHMLDRT